MDGDGVAGGQWDEAVFAELFNEHAGAILRFAQRRLPGNDAAWDVVAETFRTAWLRSATAPTSPAPVLAWLYAIAGNVVRNTQRSQRRRHDLTNRVGASLDGRSDDSYEAVDARLSAEHRLAQAFDRLGHDDQEVLRLGRMGGPGPGRGGRRARRQLYGSQGAPTPCPSPPAPSIARQLSCPG
jgi:DNA-directed RNA polymerase specialized sigma24 family protein